MITGSYFFLLREIYSSLDLVTVLIDLKQYHRFMNFSRKLGSIWSITLHLDSNLLGFARSDELGKLLRFLHVGRSKSGKWLDHKMLLPRYLAKGYGFCTLQITLRNQSKNCCILTHPKFFLSPFSWPCSQCDDLHLHRPYLGISNTLWQATRNTGCYMTKRYNK